MDNKLQWWTIVDSGSGGQWRTVAVVDSVWQSSLSWECLTALPVGACETVTNILYA